MRYLSYLGRRRLIAREGLLGTTTTTTTTNKAADDWVCIWPARLTPRPTRQLLDWSAVGPRSVRVGPGEDGGVPVVWCLLYIGFGVF